MVDTTPQKKATTDTIKLFPLVEVSKNPSDKSPWTAGFHPLAFAGWFPANPTGICCQEPSFRLTIADSVRWSGRLCRRFITGWISWWQTPLPPHLVFPFQKKWLRERRHVQAIFVWACGSDLDYGMHQWQTVPITSLSSIYPDVKRKKTWRNISLTFFVYPPEV